MKQTKSDGEAVTDALLSPIDRLSEVMFGLLMALTFTGTMSVALGGGGTVGGVLAAAIGCNVAWGIVDGTMYLLRTATERRRVIGIVGEIRQAGTAAKPGLVRQLIGDEPSRGLSEGELNEVADWVARTPAHAAHPLRAGDYKAALAIFVLVVVSTFPPILPFLIVDHLPSAMRWSNAVAVAMLLGIGWKLDDYIQRGSVTMRIAVPLIGICLVFATILLGG